MKNNKSYQNIVAYWDAVERLTPHKMDTKNTLGYIESIQQEVLGQKNIPWKNRTCFRHHQTPSKTWVYNVFLGIVNYKDIIQLMQTMLANDELDYNLQINDQVSFLCTFQLNNYGEILKETFAVPEYFISMACLNQRKKHPKDWLDLGPKIQRKVEDTYKNWVDALENRSVEFEDLKGLLVDIIDVSGVTDFHNCIKNKVMIYSSHVPVPNKFKYDKENSQEKFLNIEYYEEILGTINSSDLNILNSFYLDDIKIVSNALKDEKKPIGIGLKDYLGLIAKDKKYDLRKDKFQLEKLSNPEFLPSSRWPVSNKMSLSIAQQVAVNLALKDDKGIFSVNGPPGTGKSTLLRDIISEVITNRAKILADFVNPKDAFNNPESVSIDRFTYKVWGLDPRLLGHEIVIASTNNTAVENISKEIPRLSEIDQNYGLEYFAEIATYVNNEACWGMGAAVLGNKKNRSTFFDEFWNKLPGKTEHNKIDDNYGLDYLLNTEKPQSDWEENRKQFLSTLEEVTKLKLELVEFKNRLKAYDIFEDERDKIFDQIQCINDEVEISKGVLEDHEDELEQINSIIIQKQFQLEETEKLKPKWYVVLLNCYKKESLNDKWFDKCSDIIQEKSELSAKAAKLKSVISKLRKITSGLEAKAFVLLQKKEDLIDSAKTNYEYINLMKTKYSWSSSIADQNFWQLSDQEIQLSSPWIHEELQDLRAKLFVDAMKLHYSFIVNSSERISNNFRAAKQVMTQDTWPEESRHLFKYIWATFFLVVPSVSTTFASFGKLFKGLEEAESLGWLLIDEAGQSSPQEAIGAIYRAKRAIIVGDPLQISPVVTMPKAINEALLKYYNVDKAWSVLEESVQTLSDRVNIYGTNITNTVSSKWVGCPLRVHRRCVQPMFSVANKIAYDNLMIQATKQKISALDHIYPTSQWLDVQSNDFNGHWCTQQGEEVFKIIHLIMERHGCIPDLYVISPFKAVAYRMKALLREKSKYLLNKLKSEERALLSEWINKSIGTIHTFQGKQAEGVILLLGGNPGKPGAINWVSNYPNILNVALTRAKYKFFVVGNHKTWSSKPHFQDLAIAIPLTEVSCEAKN